MKWTSCKGLALSVMLGGYLELADVALSIYADFDMSVNLLVKP